MRKMKGGHSRQKLIGYSCIKVDSISGMDELRFPHKTKVPEVG
jgi:hypothetical protein